MNFSDPSGRATVPLMGTCNDLRNALGRNVRLQGEKKIMPVGGFAGFELGEGEKDW